MRRDSRPGCGRAGALTWLQWPGLPGLLLEWRRGLSAAESPERDRERRGRREEPSRPSEQPALGAAGAERLERRPTPSPHGIAECPVAGGPAPGACRTDQEGDGCPWERPDCPSPRSSGRPGGYRDPDLAVGDLENLKRRPRQQKAQDLKNGPYWYAEAGGDRELEEVRPDGFPGDRMRERTLRIRRVITV
ncbi:hypothetical protein NDU88_005283 [Pleurodeles waltl]|uniref:Uncharacterized protein n=1 Tax=Pleurodeles waltl TaxID=8319 RepID=A0AAV7TV68_PLEWA|nr:hypothetical protein NDU88_005283 [Pleurodeles waltl]